MTAVSNSSTRSIGRRINVRVIVFILILVAPIGAISYLLIKSMLNGGVEMTAQGAVVDLKALGNFPFNKITGTLNDVPQRYRNLDNQKVILTGFITPDSGAGSSANRFTLVYNVQLCCFSGPPQVQERVYCFMKSEKRLPPDTQLVKVSGTLHVRLVKENGVITSVYDLDVDQGPEI
jgi:hypothetical protein